MNEQLTKAITDVLVVVKDGATFAAAAAQRELPVLVEEYLKWGMAEACATALLLIVPLVWFSQIPRAWRWEKNAPHYDQGAGLALMAIFGIPTLVCGLVGIDGAMTAIQIYVAPRVYLLERLSELVK